MKTLVDTILEAVAKGGSVEICGADGLVFVDALTTRGDYYYQCRHGVACSIRRPSAPMPCSPRPCAQRRMRC